MKKLTYIFATAAVAFALTACGETAPDETVVPEPIEETTEQTPEVVLDAQPVAGGSGDSSEAVANGVSADDMAIMATGIALHVGDDFLPNADAIGTYETAEGQACLDDGVDTNYYYNGESLVVYTVADGGKQVIYDIYVTSADYMTAKGITVGTSTADDVFAAYGDPTETNGQTQIFAIAGTDAKAYIAFDANGVVESIDINNK